MRIKLIDELRQGGWRSSIMTTYSVDPQFYDRFVASRLRAYGCENNILLADAAMLDQALEADPEGFLGAGRRYAVTSAGVPGCFHPKISLRLAPDKARILIGSANVTAAGWGHNQEIACAFNYSRRVAEDAVIAPLIRKTLDYLKLWLQQPSEAIAYKLDLIDRQTPWLRDVTPNLAPIELTDGTLADIWLEAASGGTGMLASFARAIAAEKVRRLTLISPYWDTDLAGLSALRHALGDPPVTIALNPERNQFPIQALRGHDGVEFASLRDQMDRRFVHAKLIVAETADHDHMLFGSANCSDDALGTLTMAARNAEASIYRRLSAGSAAAALELDLSIPLDPSQISPPADEAAVTSRGNAIPCGLVELDIDRLIWTPPNEIEPAGAAIALPNGEQLPVTMTATGRWVAALDASPKTVLVVRLAYADGRISGPTIVNDLRALRRAAPGDYDKRLNDAIDKVLAGDGDLVDLALDAQALFSEDPASAPDSASGRAGRERTRRDTPSGDFTTPTEFREAVTARTAIGTTGRFLTDDPGLHDVLAIVLRGISSIDSRVGDKIRGDIEADDLSAGETEDGDDSNSGSGIEAPRAEPVTSPRTFKPAELESRTRKLVKVFAQFEGRIKAIAETSQPPSVNLPIQTVFMLKLMVYACTHVYETTLGTKITLMELRPAAGGDNSATFSVQATKILRGLWRETPQGSPVVRLLKPGRFEHLPDDLFFLTAMTRWAMVRALLAVAGVPKLEKLEKIIAAAAAEVFHATLRIGALDKEAEEDFVRRLDEALGFTSGETAECLNQCRRLLSAG
jgi:hypothetical protein